MFLKSGLKVFSRSRTRTYLISGIGLAGLTAATAVRTEDETDSRRCQISSLDRMIIFGGQSHPQFTQSLATRLGVEVGNMIQETFSNSEHSVQIQESVNGRDVYIVQTGRGGPQADSDLMEVLTMIHTAKINSARSVTVVLPNYPCARADKVDKPRSPIMAKLVADLLTTAGADHVVTMDLHAGQIQGFFSVPVDNLFASPAIHDWITKNVEDWSESVVVSPDMGGAKGWFRKECTWLASQLNIDFALIHKERKVANEISKMILVGDVKDKTCIILDDMSDTCGTLCKAADLLKENGAKKVIGIVTHGVLSGNALERIKKTEGLEMLVVTNTIYQDDKVANCPKLRCIDVTPTFAEAIRCKQERRSLDAVFEVEMFETLSRM